MKAIVYHQYGTPDVLSLREVEPPAVGDHEVLVRVRAASVNPYDWHQVTGLPYLVRLSGGLRRPRQSILGMDLSGRVEAIGAGVTRFRVGDDVFGMRAGAFAEYVCVHEDRLAVKPANLTYEQASAVPLAALTALQGLRDKGGLAPGHRVLVNGASGGVGTFAVQVAKALGAQVTAVCSPPNVEAARALGADRVIDYTREDFVHSGQSYDVVLDIAGNRSVGDRRRVLAPAGALVVVGGPKGGRWLGPMRHLIRVVLAGRVGRQTMVGMLTQTSRDDLALLAELLTAGSVAPVVERTYPLAQAPEAVRYVGLGHARGKVVLTL